MAVFNEPTKWAQTLGQDADVTTIPDTAGDTDPSIDKIFPSVFSIPLAQGGKAIPRSVLNGLFKLLGDWSFYQQNGGIASYSNAFDYAVGSFVKYNNQLYICIQANGASTTIKAPTNSAYWLPLMYPNDTNNILMAHNAMPSAVSDSLTLGASGASYTAPADGYVYFNKTATASGQYIDIRGNIRITVYSSAASQPLRAWLPVRKGSSFDVFYTAEGNVSAFAFFYANGSVSEQA